MILGQQPNTKHLIIQSVLPTRHAEAMVTQNSTNSPPMSGQTRGPYYKSGPISDTAWMNRKGGGRIVGFRRVEHMRRMQVTETIKLLKGTHRN